MQPMPILTPPSAKFFSGMELIQTRPHFVIQTSCKGEAIRTLGPSHMKC